MHCYTDPHLDHMDLKVNRSGTKLKNSIVVTIMSGLKTVVSLKTPGIPVTLTLCLPECRCSSIRPLMCRDFKLLVQ